MSKSDGCDTNASTTMAATGGTQLSFKDWKLKKEGQNKTNTSNNKRRQDKFREGLSNCSLRNKMRPQPSLLLNRNIEQNFFTNMSPSFGRVPPPYGNNRGTNYNNNGCGGGMDFRNKFFENGMNLNGNAFGRSNNFNGSGFSGPTFNMGPPPSGGFCRNNSNISNNFSDNFFQTDSFYYQKDMLQEPNPFRYNNNQRSNEFTRSCSASDKRKSSTTRSTTKVIEKPSKSVETPETASKLEPKIFIRNPNRNDNKKPFIPMPKHPESEPNLSTEERKQQWRDYREAMKPFKNKEFYNAKRVVQRLGKMNPSELDEKQKFRLANAQEKMAEYKQKLAEKYDSYVKSGDKSQNELGELFLLRKGNTQSNWGTADKRKPNQFKNYGNFGDISKTKTNNNDSKSPAGRKILGGVSNYSSFVPGGTLESNSVE